MINSGIKALFLSEGINQIFFIREGFNIKSYLIANVKTNQYKEVIKKS
jgi:hypothetical protein